jgi:hypothetical protein
MQASDFPNCDFIDCDACRTPYAGDDPHVFTLLSNAGTAAIETIVGVCDVCDAKLSGTDRAAAYLTYQAAQECARTRRSRSRNNRSGMGH